MNTKLKEFIEDKLKSTNRDVSRLIEYLNSTDFYIAPASTKYHGAYEGGLAEHCVDVLDTMLALNEMLSKTYGMKPCDESSIILVALLHDLCKVNTYKTETKWRKDANNKWESYIGYVRKPDLMMGHGAKSVYLANKYVDLTEEECQAIYWHMGAFDISEYSSVNELSDSYSKNVLAYLLSAADMMATYVLENENITWVNS